MPESIDFLIAGAGPTGLGAAWRLMERGQTNWLLVDSASFPGGLAASVIDSQGFTWDLGGHVLFSHYEYFDRLMDVLLGEAWVRHERESWVWMRDRFIPYPFQNNIWRLPWREFFQAMRGLAGARLRRKKEAPGNFHEWILQNYGPGIARSFLIPYNYKVWAYPPSLLDTAWMSERVAPTSWIRCLRNAVLRREERNWGPNATFRFPLRGGTGAIWRALAKKLPPEQLSFSSGIARLSPRRQEALLDDGRTIHYERLISTMPLNRLAALVEDPVELKALADQFVYSHIHVIGVGIEGKVPSFLKTKCWMYFPEPDVPFYRVTVFSNYSPFNVPDPTRYWSLLCEVSESSQKPVSESNLVADVLAGLRRTRLLPAGASVADAWHQRLEYGYPTPFLGRDKVLKKMEALLTPMNIYSRGRFGGWKYEVSNQDHSLMQGVEVVDYLLEGVPEATYYGQRPSASQPPALSRTTS